MKTEKVQWFIFKKYKGEWSLYTDRQDYSQREAVDNVYNEIMRQFPGVTSIRAFRNNKLPWSN
jgi:hypothetical protein